MRASCSGFEMAKGAHRARKLANPHVFRSRIEANQVAVDLRIPVQQLQPEGGRLSVHAVRAADGRRVLELDRSPPKHLFQPQDAMAQQPGSRLHLQRLRRVHHVVRGEAVVQPARLGTDLLRHRRGERDHIVLHFGLDVVNAL